MVWTIQGRGWAHELRMLVPSDHGRNRPRSDQYTLLIDGDEVAERIGLADILARVRKLLPRPASRRQRHESDRIAEGGWDDMEAMQE